MADIASPEAAIRSYLTYLTDPGSLIDSSAMARLEAEAAKASDPIDRLRAITAIHNAKTTSPDVYEKAFIAEAKEWADAEGIPVSAFEEMGVPRRVLESAGFLGKPTRRASRGIRRAAPVVGPVAGRRPGIKSDALEAGILALDSPFSVKDVSEKVGGSAVTVKAALDRLAAQGKITTAGERPNQRGRASNTWAVAAEPR